MAKNGKRPRRWPIVLGILLLVLTGAGFGLRAALKPKNTIDPSKLATVERGDIARSVVATGKIQPRSKVEVKSKASGIVKKLYVDYGEYVKTGQLLAELDKEQLQAQLREATATLQASQAAEESAKATFERNKVEAEGPDVPFLKSALERARKLYTQGLIANQLLEDAEKALPDGAEQAVDRHPQRRGFAGRGGEGGGAGRRRRERRSNAPKKTSAIRPS